jgi:hypothetical protein
MRGPELRSQTEIVNTHLLRADTLELGLYSFFCTKEIPALLTELRD